MPARFRAFNLIESAFSQFTRKRQRAKSKSNPRRVRACACLCARVSVSCPGPADACVLPPPLVAFRKLKVEARSRLRLEGAPAARALAPILADVRHLEAGVLAKVPPVTAHQQGKRNTNSVTNKGIASPSSPRTSNVCSQGRLGTGVGVAARCTMACCKPSPICALQRSGRSPCLTYGLPELLTYERE